MSEKEGGYLGKMQARISRKMVFWRAFGRERGDVTVGWSIV
jgi:hypothetical protein